MDNGASSYCRFISGDESGIVELIELYRDGLILYINSFTKNIVEAEDIVEDVFLKLMMRKPHYNGRASFKTWLYIIAGNVAKDYLRKKSRQGKVCLEDVSEILEDETELENMYLKEEQKIQLHHSIRKLDSEHQQILWLIYFESMSISEAASVVRKSVHATGNLVYKARKALKIQLESDGFVYEKI
ncbi:MAG: RNA polymerase sigma factor [Clostridia bacterium]|nr:RNA polymerase sigma factor [Clostridia bacterium]